MKIGDIEITPLAAESMGVRSLCTKITTPNVNILFDPSAALAMRFRLEPHPMEYRILLKTLERIFVAARNADILSFSHYHFDHIRPGFTNFRYNFSSLEELQRMVEGKHVIAKDFRENINPSQRRRGFYFEKDIKESADRIQWADNLQLKFDDTTITYSAPLPHGAEGSRLGFIVATTVEYSENKVVFCPDVQGPIVEDTLKYLLGINPDLLIIGGPPLYISQFPVSDQHKALASLTLLVQCIPVVVVDHHLMRSENWEVWLNPVYKQASESNNRLLTMAELKEDINQCLEANRQHLYSDFPPGDDFMNWIRSTDEYKMQNKPPLK